MIWSDFTIKNFDKFKSEIKSGILYEGLKKERKQIKQFLRSHKNNIIITQLKNTELLDKKIKNFSSVSWVYKKGVEMELNNLDTVYTITWNNNMITVKTTKEQFEQFKPRIQILVGMIEYLKSITNNIKKHVNVYLVLTKLEKKFPENNSIMGVKNANTGYTDFSINIIFIWRLEEFEKVLFHELIHYFDLDCRNQHIDMIDNINGEASHYEAITDFNGIRYYLIYLSLITQIKISILLGTEFKFIENQAMQLNNHFGLDDWKIIPNKIIRQETPAFAYYKLKYLLFKNAINNMIDTTDYNKLLKDVLYKGFETRKYIKIESSRMTCLQLK